MSVIFTVGYEGTDIERFIRTLKAVGISQLADIREVPISRKAGFSKTKLAARLSDAGIAYFHFAALGDPKPGREAARAGAFDLFRSIYGAHIQSERARDALRELANTVQMASTCLLCFERDPVNCHRSIVANILYREIEFDIYNLYADDPDRYVRNTAKLPRFHSGESATAA